MKRIAMSAETRTGTGKNENRRLRAAGRIPAVAYGGVDGNKNLSVERAEFERHFKHVSENVLIELDVKGGKKTEVLIRDFQKEKVRGRLIHLDFLEVRADRKLHAKVPVKTVGSAVGVRVDKGLLEIHMHELVVECLPKDVPELIEVDISEVGINHSLHVRDLKLPAGVAALDSPDGVILICTGKKSDIDAPVAAAAEAAPAAAPAGKAAPAAKPAAKK